MTAVAGAHDERGAIEFALQYCEAAAERQRLLEHITRIQRLLIEHASLATVLHAICDSAAELLGDEVVGLRLVDPDDPDKLVIVAEVGVSDAIRVAVTRTPMADGVGGRAVLDGCVVVADDYAHASFALPEFQTLGLRAAMAAPVVEDAAPVGSLTVATYRPARRYTEWDQAVLQVLADHASLALSGAGTIARLHMTVQDAMRDVTHDRLTGLPNRSVVFERLEAAMRAEDGHTVGLLFVDLDRFKAVNDSLGHDVGDRVLATVAQRLRAAVRPGDLIGRLAGDEFVVVFSGLHGAADALGLAGRIQREVSAPIQIANRDVLVTASIGIAHASSGGAMTADELLREADMAMFRAKQRGSDRVEVFGRNMRDEVADRLDIEHALRQAVTRDELRVEYQPVLRMGDGEPVLVEALVRWDRAGATIPPAAFIPIAESTGLIVPIGGLVLHAACAQIAEWRSTEPLLATMQVSVNVSMRQFADDRFVATVAGALEATGLAPSALWLEVTESVLLDDIDGAIRTLRALKALGVRLSIDDFGTGYSSLSYLRRFPVDALKVDRSFVERLGSEPEEAAILEAIVALGRALGVGVVAEGVETALQLDEVGRLGCDAAQGFLFARPLPPEPVRAWLVERLSRIRAVGARAG